MVTRYGHRALYTFGASKDADDGIPKTHLLQFEAMVAQQMRAKGGKPAPKTKEAPPALVAAHQPALSGIVQPKIQSPLDVTRQVPLSSTP